MPLVQTNKPKRTFGSLSRNFFKKGLSILSRDKEKALLPYSKASEDLTEVAFTDLTYFQKPGGKKALEILYRNSWACFKAVNVRANLLATRGLKINTKEDKAKAVVKNLLKNMHPTRPMLALQNSFRNRSINADVFGNAFDELLYSPLGTPEKPALVKNAKDLFGFTVIHPINIDFERDMGNKILFDNGVPKGWKYAKDPSSPIGAIKLELDRVAHLKYNQIGDELLGMSTLEPIFKTAERLMKIEEGITQGILTHGNPLHDVIVGDESHPPTKEMIDNVANEVIGLNSKSEYVHPPWIRVGQIESFSLGKAPNYMQPYITAIAAATGVPEFILLGRGEGTNKATAQTMIQFIHQTIEPLQQAQALYFEEKILAPLMKLHKIEEVPTIEWNDILPKSIQDYANVIKVLSSIAIGGEPVLTIEEAREMAGLGPKVGFKKGELKEKSLPGIYLTEPHGELIQKGRKKLIVKSKEFSEMIQKPLYLVSDARIYGIIKLREPVKISLSQFDDLAEEHLISDKEREAWWPHYNELFSYRFNVLQMFKEPKPYSLPKGIQTFIKEISL